MQPTVSIIVPVYNAESTLRRCVDSILNQDYRDFELILVNDGSQDSSGAICDTYAAQDPRVIAIHKPNTGVSDTRNLAISRARGTYLQFLDSDDWITPDATTLLVQTARQHDCDLVISDFYRVVGERVSRKGDIDDDTVLTREEYAAHMMENPADFYYGVLWNKLYRRSIVERWNLRMDPEISCCEDFMFNLEYIRRARLIAATAQPVYCYVKRPGSLVATQATLARTVEMKRTMFAAYKRLYQALDLYDEQKLRVYGYLVSAAKDGGSVALRPPALPKRRPESPRRRTRRRRTGMA